MKKNDIYSSGMKFLHDKVFQPELIVVQASNIENLK